jgi:nucleotide-binding universal stress UspA family protein
MKPLSLASALSRMTAVSHQVVQHAPCPVTAVREANN